MDGHFISAYLNDKMGATFTAAAMEFDSVVMEISDVHKS